MAKRPYDFCGWATKNDLVCTDGRIIRQNAFADNDKKKVPLVYGHDHSDPTNILGHGILENRPEGVFMYGYLNHSEKAEHMRKALDNGDIEALSIYANKLKQNGANVLHGDIKEVSLVLAGANPGANIVDVMIAHGDDANDEECIVAMCEGEIELYHEDKKEEKEMAEEKKENGGDKTIKDIIDTMNEEQKNAMYFVVGKAVEDAKGGEDDEEEDEVKHNEFDDVTRRSNVLTHADQKEILDLAKNRSVGSFKNALDIFAQENDFLQHDDEETTYQNLGFDHPEYLFPEYKNLGPAAPEMLTTDQGWISHVLNKVHKSPIARIRTRQADIRDISNLRAKGYKKGDEKSYVGNISLIRRTTDPQTVYVKSKLDRDDILDIEDFDYVQYMYNIDRMNLNEELATAIIFGDGRADGADGKIYPDKIRPIWTDDELYTIHTDVDIAAAKAELQGTETAQHFGDNYVYAEAVISTLLYATEQYKGSGNKTFYCTPHLLNVMLLARDLNGRRIYDSKTDLAAALNVNEIITMEQADGKTRTVTVNGTTKTKKFLGLIGNLSDYSLGSMKGGQITHFTDFDLNFNQEISLLETRCSGAITRVKSFIALEEDVTA